jgi:RNA polymerase sigma-70 factor (ECF subfamily)
MTDLLILLFAISADGGADDRALSERIAAGDHLAFRAFYERHHADLARYLRRRGLAVAETEDILQQAFITIWEKRAAIRPDLPLRGYLFRIGLSRALNLFRDTAKFSSVDLRMEDIEDASADELHRHELMDALHAAIASLPVKRREVFELCYLQEFSYREAAEALDISPKTVENHMGMALKELRVKLSKWV